MIDPARIREHLALLRRESDELEAMLAAAAANTDPAVVIRPPTAPAPATWAPTPGKGVQYLEAVWASLTADNDVFGGRMAAQQKAGVLRLCEAAAGVLPLGWAAYLLATAYHECGGTMTPIAERGGHAYLDKYDTGRLAAVLGNTPQDDDDGQKWAGRGDVQLTGWTNYKRADAKLAELGLISAGDLLANPALALRPDLSSVIAVHGMREGWFTGKGFNHYIGSRSSPLGTLESFTAARRIINGQDKAVQIARYAMAFQEALIAGGWL